LIFYFDNELFDKIFYIKFKIIYFVDLKNKDKYIHWRLEWYLSKQNNFYFYFF